MKSLIRCVILITSIVIILSACGPAETPAATPIATPTAAPVGKYVIGYYPYWVAERNVFVKDIPAHKLTHINPSDAVVAQGQKVILSTSSIRTYADPKTFGKITLVK